MCRRQWDFKARPRHRCMAWYHFTHATSVLYNTMKTSAGLKHAAPPRCAHTCNTLPPSPAITNLAGHTDPRVANLLPRAPKNPTKTSARYLSLRRIRQWQGPRYLVSTFAGTFTPSKKRILRMATETPTKKSYSTPRPSRSHPLAARVSEGSLGTRIPTGAQRAPFVIVLWYRRRLKRIRHGDWEKIQRRTSTKVRRAEAHS